MFAGQRLEVSTAVGEVRDLTLKDGTRISLAPGSRIRTRVGPRGREVELTAGEAFFEVAHDPRRPFTVQAGDTVIRDIGTRFDIVRTGARVRVSVLEGSVEVSRRSGEGSTARTLVGGQGAETGPAPLAGVAGLRPAPILVQAASPTAGSWRSGRLSYDDARLGDIVADLNRYYPAGVRLQDPALAGRRVAASFRVEEIGTFLANLPKALPVTVSTDAQGGAVIAPAAPPKAS
jgi:transmembrane sensor